MSIASRINVQRADAENWANRLLFEPDNAEIKVSIIGGVKFGTTPQPPTEVFAETLSAIKAGIEDGKIEQTLATIDLLVELAYLESSEYGNSLEQFRAKVDGRLTPEGQIEPRSTASADADSRTTEVTDERVNNVMRLGDQLQAVATNPETPEEIRRSIMEFLSERLIREINEMSIEEEFSAFWPRIAEMLLAKSEQEGGAKDE